MAESMKRLDPGHYTITLGGVQYWVTMEKKRVETGKSKKGTEKSIWSAKRGDYVLMESERYRDAKRAVFDDAALPADQRPGSGSETAEPVEQPVEPVGDGSDQAVSTQPDDSNEQVTAGQGPEVDEHGWEGDGGSVVEEVPQAQASTVVDSDNFEQHLSEPAMVPDEAPDQDDQTPHFSWA